MSIKSKQRSLAEKISFGVSLFIVSLLFVLVCFAWITGDNNPPILSITTGSNIRQAGDLYYVPFTVTNSGGETVESVEVVARLVIEEDEETGRQQIDFLSCQEQRNGAFIFDRNPQQGELTVRVASYKLP